MGTVPTGRLEREMRKFYLSWVEDLPEHTSTPEELEQYVATLKEDMTNLIESLGGEISRMGIDADFPAPKMLDLRLHADTVYSEIDKAAIRAGISIGLNARDTAMAIMKTSVGREYYKVERLARTETVNAYWKNQWAEAAGLDLVMLWSAERGPRTCEECLSKDGLVVADESIRDHPNGRCTLQPVLPQNVEYKGTLQPDGSVSYDPDWKAAYETLEQPATEKPKTTAKKTTAKKTTNPKASTKEAKMSDFAPVDLDNLGATFAQPKLTEAQRDAVVRYQTQDFEYINEMLRAGTISEDIQDTVKQLDKVMKPLKKDTVVYRSQGQDSWLDFFGIDYSDPWSDDPEDWDMSKSIGKTWNQKSFLSTTASREYARDFDDSNAIILNINAPKGTKATYVQTGDDLDMEKEVLFSRDKDYLVTDARISTNEFGEKSWIIDLVVK